MSASTALDATAVAGPRVGRPARARRTSTAGRSGLPAVVAGRRAAWTRRASPHGWVHGVPATTARQARSPGRRRAQRSGACAQRHAQPSTWRRRGRSRIIAALFPPATDPRAHGPVHLHHESRREDRAPEARDPPRHLAQLLPRRQDRRARPERLGQVHAAPDHGGRRQGVRGRGPAAARHQDRLPRAGAAARRVEGRPWQCRDGRRPTSRTP